MQLQDMAIPGMHAMVPLQSHTANSPCCEQLWTPNKPD